MGRFKKTLSKVIAVQTIFNTNENNVPIPQSVAFHHLPMVYHGPFKSLEAAKNWMFNVYPEDDETVEEQFYGEFDVDKRWLNDPNKLFS